MVVLRGLITIELFVNSAWSIPLYLGTLQTQVCTLCLYYDSRGLVFHLSSAAFPRNLTIHRSQDRRSERVTKHFSIVEYQLLHISRLKLLRSRMFELWWEAQDYRLPNAEEACRVICSDFSYKVESKLTDLIIYHCFVESLLFLACVYLVLFFCFLCANNFWLT